MLVASRRDDAWREEIISLQDQINSKREAGEMDEVARLQLVLRDKVRIEFFCLDSYSYN